MQISAAPAAALTNKTAVSTKAMVRLFDGFDEYFNVGLGVLVPLAVFLEQRFFQYRLTDLQTNFLTLVVAMDVIHIGYTYTMLSEIPELKVWQERRKGGALRLGLNVFLIGSLVFCALLALHFWAGVSQRSLRALLSIGLMLKILVPEWHGVNQIKGLTLGYNQKIRAAFPFTEQEKAKARSHERREKKCIDLFFWSFAWLLFAANFRFDLLGIHLSEDASGLFVKASIGLCIGMALLTLGHSLFFPKALKSFKGLYLCRILMYPFTTVSPIAGLGQTSCHGVEYFFVYRNIKRRSNITPARKKILEKKTIFVAAFLAFLSAPAWLVPEESQTVWMYVLISFAVALGYTHYYLDRLIFRMRVPETRALVGPLFPG